MIKMRRHSPHFSPGSVAGPWRDQQSQAARAAADAGILEHFFAEPQGCEGDRGQANRVANSGNGTRAHPSKRARQWRHTRSRVRAVALGLALTMPTAALAAERPGVLQEVAFEQRIGEQIPLDVPFRDESGQTVRLADYVAGRPILLVPAYFQCPMLCTVVLDSVVSTLRTLSFDVGKEFAVVVFSFNPKESPAEAAEKKRQLVERYRRPGTENGWHVLTGDEASIRPLTEAIGFRYKFDAASGQYAHGSGVVIVTPTGRISHYFYGVEYPARDVRLALVEASADRIGSPVDQLLLFCFQYDPTTGRYSRPALRAIRVGGAATVLALAAFVIVMLRRGSKHQAPHGGVSG